MKVVWFVVGALAAVARAAVWVIDTAERGNKELHSHRYIDPEHGHDE